LQGVALCQRRIVDNSVIPHIDSFSISRDPKCMRIDQRDGFGEEVEEGRLDLWEWIV